MSNEIMLKEKLNQVPKFPLAIEIQTTSACNAGCVICPHSEVWDEGLKGNMQEEVFRKILMECKPHQDNLLIIPYLNAEPFMDKNFINKVRLINSICPNSRIEISTNLSLLNSRRRKEMIGLNIYELRLSIFGFSNTTHKNMMPKLNWSLVEKNLNKLVEDEEFRKGIKHISLTMIEHQLVPSNEYLKAEEFCKKHNISLNKWGFLDRAGNVKDFSNDIKNEKVVGCEQNRPIERLHVRYDGKVILCCQDWRSSVVIGDIQKQTINEVWNSSEYNDYRLAIYGGENNEAPELCKKCILAVRL